MTSKQQDREAFLKSMQYREYLKDQQISSINAEDRTVDIVFFTGIDVPRRNYWGGKNYILRFDPAGADFSYLNNGAPIFDNHMSYGGSTAQKGRVEKAWTENKQYKATLRFSKRDSVTELWKDIEDKIITKFSMGVEILELLKEEKNGQEIHIAKKWRPFELSIAPVPADFNTTTLAAEDGGQINNEQMGISPKGDSMPKEVKTPGAEAHTLESPEAAPPVDTEKLTKEALATDRKRISGIQAIALKHKISQDKVELAIENNVSVADFGLEVLNGLGQKDAEEAQDSPIGIHRTTHDEVDKRRLAMEIALDGMFDTSKAKKDEGNDFQGLRLMRFAEESVRRQHNLNRIPSQEEVVKLAMQGTSDFSYVLENSARKQLLAQYALISPTYRTWAKRSTTPDFKTMSRIRLSEAPSLLPVAEGAQIQIASMSDTREQYAVSTHGRGVSFTRQMLINDDLGAFNDLIGQFGAQAARAENAIVYAILNDNAVLSDSIALFYATHYNLGTGAIGNTALDAGYAAMRKQLGVDGVSILNIMPKYLIVPVAKETTARAAMTAIGPNVKASDQNHFAGRFEVVSDAELDGTSTTVWYLAADPNIHPGVEYCFLEGAEGPQFVKMENQNGILGIQFYCFEDFGAKAVDFRPLYKSSGS